jgi:hypothetical protein
MFLSEMFSEASYKGNIGAMEMFRFYQQATPEQIKLMKQLIAQKKLEKAWNFLQKVTGTKLHPMTEADAELMYKGYPCTKDCSGHIAGDDWAEKRKITDPKQCPYGSSNSFWEGCKSQAEENQ